jgi:indolepyruvate ferredoxin oxidoreductase
MAAHLDGKAAGVMEMAGLAQKGGAVHIHCRIGETPEDISAIRVALGECDALIGGDLVVSAQGSTLGLMAPTGRRSGQSARNNNRGIHPRYRFCNSGR